MEHLKLQYISKSGLKYVIQIYLVIWGFSQIREKRENIGTGKNIEQGREKRDTGKVKKDREEWVH